MAAGYSLEDVARELMCSPAKVSRIETGQRGIQARDVRDLSRFYGAGPVVQQQLLSLTAEAARPGWWASFRALDGEMISFIGLESAAVEVRVFHATIVPGLLQTPDYTRAMLRPLRPSNWTEEEQLDIVAARAERQARVLNGDLLCSAIIDEAVLRREIGSRHIMAAQMDHLLKSTELPNVSLRVVPFRSGSYPGIDGNFQWMSFEPGTVGDLVFVEGHLGYFLLDKASEAARYEEIFSSIDQSFAIDEQQTRDFLRSLLR